jgi:hypothetical protein
MPAFESDAAAIGTSVHAAIEVALQERQSEHGDLTIDDAFYIATQEMKQLIADPAFVWVKYTPEKADELIGSHLTQWYEQFYPYAEPIWTEQKFKIKLVEDDEREIYLSGTADYMDNQIGLVDWKTSSRDYKEWEYRRWAIQPTVYCTAFEQPQFTYFVMKPPSQQIPGAQQFTVERDSSHAAWLRQQLKNLALQIESGIAPWPLNDQHALCSDKWCPIFQGCKGVHVTI